MGIDQHEACLLALPDGRQIYEINIICWFYSPKGQILFEDISWGTYEDMQNSFIDSFQG